MAEIPIATQLSRRIAPNAAREINNEYHLEILAKNSDIALRGQQALLTAQVTASVVQLRTLAEQTRKQDEANNILESIDCNFDALLNEAVQLNNQLCQLRETMDHGFEEVANTLDDGFSSVVLELKTMVQLMENQVKSLNAIAGILSAPYDTKAQELLREGNKWLMFGEKVNGREKSENLKDALKLFQEVVSNSIGKQNYTAWFNIGYLYWKHFSNPREAEEAFFAAQRLSAPNQDLWHTKSLRHLAAVQYDQGNDEDAYGSIIRALNIPRAC